MIPHHSGDESLLCRSLYECLFLGEFMNHGAVLTIVQLINHELSRKLMEKVKGAEELFSLPMEEKKKFSQRW